MIDTEINRLCAELCEAPITSHTLDGIYYLDGYIKWNPLENAEQAELVEHYLIDIGYVIVKSCVTIVFDMCTDEKLISTERSAQTIAERRRALCEFAAQVQKEKA